MGITQLFGGAPKDNTAEMFRRQQAEAEKKRLDEQKSRLDKEAQSSRDIAANQSKRRAFVNQLVATDDTDTKKKYLQAV